MANLSEQRLGNYHLICLLGQGGFADVYQGEQIHIGTQAAIKVLHTRLASDDVERFRKEARIIWDLKHPNIVPILDFGVEGDIPFLVMEYAPFGTLRQLHPRGSILEPSVIVPYVKQIAAALQYAHDQKVIHRDVKPENLLLGRTKEVLLSDFGLAVIEQSTRAQRTSNQSTLEAAGTLYYMAPEQIQGKPVQASDQYALGVVIYEWLTGERPFNGMRPIEIAMQHLSTPPPPLRAKIPSISPSTEEVVQRALAKDPQHRFESVQAFASALEDAFQSTLKAAWPKESPLPLSPASKPAMRAWLNGPSEQTVLGPNTVPIGRTPDNQLVVNDPQVSEPHAEIRPEGQGDSIVNLNSTNSTLVKGQPLKNTSRPLNQDDANPIGDRAFPYEVIGTSQSGAVIFDGSTQRAASGWPGVGAALPSHTGYGMGVQQEEQLAIPSSSASLQSLPHLQMSAQSQANPLSYIPTPTPSQPPYAPQSSGIQPFYTPSQSPQPQKPRSTARAIILAAVALVIIFGGVSGFFVIHGRQVRPNNTPTATAPSLTTSIGHAVRLDSPAIVRIISTVDARLICYSCASDGSNVVSPQSGSFNFAVSGSGAFISPDGYILTADHVVDHTTNNQGDVDFIKNEAASDIAQRYSSTPNAVLQFFQNHPNQVEIDMAMTSQQVFFSTAYTGQLQNTAQVISYPVTRIVANSPVDKQDTAILLVQQAHDVPYLQLAPNDTINMGDTITALAYPGDADLGDFTCLVNPTQCDTNTLNSLLDVSVNTGQITSQKTLPDGTPVYEVGGGIASPGSSGGPVIDQQGQIIGFVDASSSTNRLIFLIPSDVAKSYIGGIPASNGAFMSLWTKAINAYDAAGPCHWTQASQDLKQLRDNYPQFGGALPFLQEAQKRATPAECPPPPPASPNYGAIFGSLGVGIVLVASILLLFMLRRRKQATPTRGLTPPSPPMPYSPLSGTVEYGSAMQRGVQAEMSGSAGSTSQVLHWAPPQPTRQCLRGHVISDRMAHFCSECGAPVQEVHVQR